MGVPYFWSFNAPPARRQPAAVRATLLTAPCLSEACLHVSRLLPTLGASLLPEGHQGATWCPASQPLVWVLDMCSILRTRECAVRAPTSSSSLSPSVNSGSHQGHPTSYSTPPLLYQFQQSFRACLRLWPTFPLGGVPAPAPSQHLLKCHLQSLTHDTSSRQPPELSSPFSGSPQQGQL